MLDLDHNNSKGGSPRKSPWGVLIKCPKLRLRHLCPQLLGRSNWGNFEDLLMGGIRRENQLSLVVYPHYDGFYTSQVVFLGISEPSTVSKVAWNLERTTFFDLSSMLCFNDSLELDIEASLGSSFLLNCLCVLPVYEVGKCWQWNGSHPCSQMLPTSTLPRIST